jgi:hypothetical protein
LHGIPEVLPLDNPILREAIGNDHDPDIDFLILVVRANNATDELLIRTPKEVRF